MSVVHISTQDAVYKMIWPRFKVRGFVRYLGMGGCLLLGIFFFAPLTELTDHITINAIK